MAPVKVSKEEFLSLTTPLTLGEFLSFADELKFLFLLRLRSIGIVSAEEIKHLSAQKIKMTL